MKIGRHSCHIHRIEGRPCQQQHALTRDLATEEYGWFMNYPQLRVKLLEQIKEKCKTDRGRRSQLQVEEAKRETEKG